MAAPAGTGNDRAYFRPASRDDFEIAIICALPREMDAVELLVDKFWTDEVDQNQYGKIPGDTNTYELARIGRFNVVLVTLANMGKVEAAAAAQCVATSYLNISLVLLVGVCGGMPFVKAGGEREEIFLGDVVISSILNQYDFGRQLSDRFLSKTEVEDTFGRPNRDLRSLLRSLEKVRARDKLQSQAARNLVQLQEKSRRNPRYPRYTYPGTDKDRLFEASYEHKHHSPALNCPPCAQGSICESSREICESSREICESSRETCESSRETCESSREICESSRETCESSREICELSREIACDDIGCDTKYLVKRKRCGQPDQPMVFIGRVGSADAVVRSAKHRDAHAEKGIIALEMEGAGVWDVLPCLVIKGVCDYADSHKNKGWQGYAAATAASVAKAFLDCYQGTGKLSGRASEHQTIPTPAPFLNAPFQPDDDFVERDEIMSWLQTELNNKGGRAALVGIGGVGKSRLAIRYARNTQKTYPQTYVLWVYAGTQALFIGSFREIAHELSLDGWDDVKVDVLRLVLTWLRSDNRQWLMILDNADDINVFDPKPDERKDSDSGAASSTALKPLDFLRRCQNGNILITSRSEKVVRRLGVGLHFRRVEPMIKGQARQLLRHKLATVEDESEEENLIDALDCIPLAITQAAAYINHLASTERTSVRVYLEQFRESENNQAVLLNHLPEDEASGPVFTTWIITYDHIRKERPSASDLLSLLSFFYHRGIPEWVLETYYKNFETYHPHAKLPQDCLDPLAEDVATLCSYSLVTVVPVTDNQDSRQLSSRSLQMHALVHTCTRHWLRSNNVDRQWLSTVTELLGTAHPSQNDSTWAKCAEISPHVDSLLTFPGLEHLDEPQTANLVGLLGHAAGYNTDIGALGRAESLVLKALDVAEKRLCNTHDKIYLVLYSLKGLSHHKHALKTRLVSTANRFCAGLINSLTTPSEEFGALSAYMQPNSSATVAITSDFDEHTAEHKRVILSIQDMKSAGFDNPTALEMGHLVRFILNAPFCHSTVPAFKVIRKLTWVLDALERYQDMEIIYRALLKGQTCFTDQELDIWGDSNWPWRAEETEGLLCGVLIKQDKYQEAEELLRMFLIAEPENYDHYDSLGWVLWKQNRFKEAEKVFRKALDLRYTPDDDFEKDLTPQMYTEEGLWYNRCLGNTLALQGKHAEAVVCFRQILKWSRQLQLLEHPKTLGIYACLGKSLGCLGEYKEAESLLKHSVEVCERKFSHDHDVLSDYLVALLENLKSQGREGEEEYEKFENRLDELGYKLVSSDNDDSCKELDSGSELSADGSQADTENGQSGKAQSNYLNIGSTSGPSQPSEMAQTINTGDPDPIPIGMDLTRQENECHEPQDFETFRDTAHSVRPNIGRSASEDSDSSDDVRTASRVIEQLKGRLEGRENTSRPGMKKFFAIGLGKRRSLRGERALEDCMRLLKEREVEKEAGEELDKDRNVVRGDEDEVEEDVE